MRLWLGLPRLSGVWMRAAIAPALIFIASATDCNYLADFWHHLARGRAIAEQGRLVDTDLFTYTVPGRAFQDCNWLTQLAYYRLYELGGLPLVQLVNALALAVMMGLLVHLAWRKSGSLGWASVLGVFAFFGLWQVLTIRPQTLSLLLFVLLYEILDLAERRPWLLVLAPVILALWANLHGAFPAGLILITAFLGAAVWESWQRGRWRLLRDRRSLALAACLLASVLATLLNPYTWHIYEYIGLTSSAAANRRIDEWVPPGPNMLIGKFWMLSLLLVVVAFALPRRRPTARDVFLILAFLPLACGSARMVAWWLLITAPILATLFAANWPVIARSVVPEPPSVASAGFFGLIVLAMVFSIPGLSRFNPLLGPSRRTARPEQTLQQVADWVSARGPGARIFSRFEWGEYLTWSLGPRYPVFMDGRIEIYPDDVWAQYAAVTEGRGDWEKVLDRYDVNYLLVDTGYHQGTGLLAQVAQSAEWTSAFQVGNAQVFVRRSASAGSNVRTRGAMFN